jgi:hypothetical protein
MMRNIIFLVPFLVLINHKTMAQDINDYEDIEQTIRTFFDGFHKKDTTILNSVLFKQVQIQTIKTNSENNDLHIENESVEAFLKSITLIPETTNFKEVIHDYQIKGDGLLATAWTPYSFFVNETLSHCGTNNFQLIRENGVWKIISIIDTRKKENCKD